MDQMNESLTAYQHIFNPRQPDVPYGIQTSSMLSLRLIAIGALCIDAFSSYDEFVIVIVIAIATLQLH